MIEIDTNLIHLHLKIDYQLMFPSYFIIYLGLGRSKGLTDSILISRDWSLG